MAAFHFPSACPPTLPDLRGYYLRSHRLSWDDQGHKLPFVRHDKCEGSRILDKWRLGPGRGRRPRSLQPPTGLSWKYNRISSLFHGAMSGLLARIGTSWPMPWAGLGVNFEHKTP
jgi:hypothetical protein